MYKELIISIIIVIAIFSLDYITQKYTDYTIAETTSGLETIKSEIKTNKISSDEADKKISDLYNNWNKIHDTLAYYIEHNELEKVETELTKLKADIDMKEYKMGVENLDNCIFILEHIKDKTALKIVNIF